MVPGSRGFTLIETMVIALVVTLMIAMALPSLAALLERQRTLAIFHQLTASLALARLSAVRLNEPVTLCPSRDGRQCRRDLAWEAGWIAYRDPRREPQPARPEAVLEHVNAPAAGMSVRSSVGRHRVRFHPSGWASGSNLSLQVCSLRDGRLLGRVVVNNAGRPRTEHPRAPDAPCPFAP